MLRGESHPQILREPISFACKRLEKSSPDFSDQLFSRATELTEREKIYCNLALAMVHADARNALAKNCA
jgi:hypothetical protein